MKTVNALTIRNKLGSVLEELDKTREPILVSKGRKVRAVLISIEDFERRFVDKHAEEKRNQLIARIKALRAERLQSATSLEMLRAQRGYRT